MDLLLSEGAFFKQPYVYCFVGKEIQILDTLENVHKGCPIFG